MVGIIFTSFVAVVMVVCFYSLVHDKMELHKASIVCSYGIAAGIILGIILTIKAMAEKDFGAHFVLFTIGYLLLIGAISTMGVSFRRRKQRQFSQ